MLDWGAVFHDSREKPSISIGERIPLTCPICGIHTDMEIMGYFISRHNRYISLPDSGMVVFNYFLKCTRCNGASLLMWSYGEESYGRGITAGKRIYPFLTTSEIDEFKDSIPVSIFQDIKQSMQAFYAGAFLGAGLLLRRACQNICRDKLCEGRNLVGEIDDLVNKGLITRDSAELAHSIRIIGNEIAHPSPNDPFIIKPKDIRESYEFIKQLVHMVYINPAKSRALKESLTDRGVK